MGSAAAARTRISAKHASTLEKRMREAASYKNYAELPNIEDIIRNAVEKDPKLALAYASHYTQEGYAEAMIRQAAESLPEAALKYAHRYADEPYAEAIISKAAALLPEAALKYAHRYAGKPYAMEIIHAAAEALPSAALKYAEHYGEQFYAEPIIRRAAQINPIETLHYSRSLSRLPYAQDIFRRATESDPWTDTKKTQYFQRSHTAAREMLHAHIIPIQFSDVKHLLFSFEGRVTCSIQWLSAFIVHGSFITAAATSSYRTGEMNIEIIIMTWLFFTMWIAFVTTAKRLHDLNQPGWYAMSIFIPCLGPMLILMAGIYEGNEGRNDYGDTRYSLF